MTDPAKNSMDALDQRLTRALEAAPSPVVVDDFAQRVMSRLPDRRPMPASLPALPSIARRVSFAVLGLMFFAMLALGATAGGTGHAPYAAVEYVLAVEFIALTVWLSLRKQASE